MPSAHLFRYFLRRWMLPVLAALPFFVGLMLAYQLRIAARLVDSVPGASYRWILPLIATTIPEIISQVLPMAAVLGGLIGMQQLSEGSELVASQGLGAGLRSIIRPWIVLALLLGSAATLNVHVLVPQAMVLHKHLRQAMESEALEGALKPGERPYMPRQHPGRALWLSEGGELHLMDSGPESVQHLVARRFQLWKSTEDRPYIGLQMNDIKGVQVRKSDASVLLVDMKEQSIRFELPKPRSLLAPTPLKYLSTGELFGQESREAWVELSRRITLPLASATLLLLGIAMGISHPRFRRGGALLRSLGAILGYFVLMTLLENQFTAGKIRGRWVLFILPFGFGVGAFLLLCQRLRPHHDNRWRVAAERFLVRLSRHSLFRRNWVKAKLALRRFRMRTRSSRRPVLANRSPARILRNWTNRAFLRNWAGTLAIFLTLDLMLEFATMAGDMAQSHSSAGVFLQYWLWNLPTFTGLILPMTFLFAGLLTLSDASVTHEWVAMRAGGISLVQWIRSGIAAWMAVLLFTFALQGIIAPHAAPRADRLYDRIKMRTHSGGQIKPWLHLTGTGVLWHMDGARRWGFPLRSPGEGAPVLFHWRLGASRVEQLPWGGLSLEPGVEADRLFPTEVLRNYEKPEHIPTFDLIDWQRFAPEPDRATMLWTRLLGWLSGPCLAFAAFSYAFPPPRQGRGQALGFGLVVCLVYTGFQMIMADASRSGEVPATWATVLPLLLCLAFGLLRIPKLRT